jgi:hypothetical protein
VSKPFSFLPKCSSPNSKSSCLWSRFRSFVAHFRLSASGETLLPLCFFPLCGLLWAFLPGRVFPSLVLTKGGRAGACNWQNGSTDLDPFFGSEEKGKEGHQRKLSTSFPRQKYENEKIREEGGEGQKGHLETLIAFAHLRRGEGEERSERASLSFLIKTKKKRTRPRVRRHYPPDLSISLSGGKETNRDPLSSGERSGKSSGLKSECASMAVVRAAANHRDTPNCSLTRLDIGKRMGCRQRSPGKGYQRG